RAVHRDAPPRATPLLAGRPAASVMRGAVATVGPAHAASHRHGVAAAALSPASPWTARAPAAIQLSGPMPTGRGRYRIVAASNGQHLGSVAVRSTSRSSVEVTDLRVQ